MGLDTSAVSVPVGRESTVDTPESPTSTQEGCPKGPASRPESARREPAASTFRTPPIDIYEGPDGLVLEADLPGVAEKNLSIQVDDNVLSLRGRVTSAIPEDARPLHEGCRPGDFYRSFILSDEVDRDGIVAELKNGVLRLVLPKAERARTRRIEIKTS